MAKSMNELVNLDCLVSNIYQWKMEYEKMVAKTEKLHKDLEFKELQFQLAIADNNSLQHETSQLNSSVHDLQNTVQKLLHYEVENAELMNKVMHIEEKMQDMQSEHENKIQSIQAQIMEMKDTHVAEISEMKKKSELEVQANGDVYKKILYEKEHELLHHIEHLSRLQKQHDEEILKTKLEYDHKLMKMQEHARSIKPTPNVTISTNAKTGMDILRKKMQNMQHQHELEMAEMRKKLAELQNLSPTEQKQHSTHQNLSLKRKNK